MSIPCQVCGKTYILNSAREGYCDFHYERFIKNREASILFDKHKTRKAIIAEQNKAPWMRMINSAKRRSEDKGILFDLSYEWGRDRWTGKCELTDIPFIRGSPKNPYTPSLDRIIPKLGYVQTNCRFICLSLNFMKGIWDDSYIYNIAKNLTLKQVNVSTYPSTT